MSRSAGGAIARHCLDGDIQLASPGFLGHSWAAATTTTQSWRRKKNAPNFFEPKIVVGAKKKSARKKVLERISRADKKKNKIALKRRIRPGFFYFGRPTEGRKIFWQAPKFIHSHPILGNGPWVATPQSSSHRLYVKSKLRALTMRPRLLLRFTKNNGLS